MTFLSLLGLFACTPLVGTWWEVDAPGVPLDDRCRTCQTCIQLHEDGWVESMAFEPAVLVGETWTDERWYAGAPGEWETRAGLVEATMIPDGGWASEQEWSFGRRVVTIREEGHELADDAELNDCGLSW